MTNFDFLKKDKKFAGFVDAAITEKIGNPQKVFDARTLWMIE